MGVQVGRGSREALAFSQDKSFSPIRSRAAPVGAPSRNLARDNGSARSQA